MADGKTHDRVAKVVAAISIPTATAITHDLRLGLVAGASALFSGLMFGPDLDHRNTSNELRRWGNLKFIWHGYRFWLIPRHRHPLSHAPIVGTVVRCLYFGGCLAIAICGLLIISNLLSISVIPAAILLVGSWLKEQPNLLISVFVGVEIGAVWHLLYDWPPSIWIDVFVLRKRRKR